MQIREAKEGDIPEILEVLKASLGEVSSKKTEKIWRYKHVDNPFGKSLVLVALENKEIIGVRAFMRWNWQKGNQLYSAFRAVDTATHPSHQGKGIFKKLTLAALETAKSNGDHFVFNTPNENSKPGYLKMGWVEVGKLKIQVSPVNPVFYLKLTRNYFQLRSKNTSNEKLQSLLEEFQEIQTKNGIFTPKNAAYLDWRYKKNPIQEYMVESRHNFYIAAYVKKRGKLKEFRVSEKICLNDKANKEANKKIKKMARSSGAHFISSLPGENAAMNFGIKGNYGPVLTHKNINLGSEDLFNFRNIEDWNYSIGDLEIF